MQCYYCNKFTVYTTFCKKNPIESEKENTSAFLRIRKYHFGCFLCPLAVWLFAIFTLFFPVFDTFICTPIEKFWCPFGSVYLPGVCGKHFLSFPLMLSFVENLFFQKNPLQDLLSSLSAVISTNESTWFKYNRSHGL